MRDWVRWIMPEWLRWILSTDGFKTPQNLGGAWTAELVSINVFTNALLAVVFLALSALLWGLIRSGQVQYRSLANAFCLLLFLTGLTNLARAAGYVWPAYRLLVGLNIVNALTATVAVAILAPLVFSLHLMQKDEDIRALARVVQAYIQELSALKCTIAETFDAPSEEVRRSDRD